VKITAFVHFSVPYRMAGSETMLHTMLVALAEAGHEVTCVTSDMEAPEHWTWGPVKGIAAKNLIEGERAVLESAPDVVISHHQNSIPAIRLAKGIGAKSVFIQHNSFPENSITLLENPDLVVFNTQWISEMWAHHTRRSVIVHPPVRAEEHAATPGDRITMVNLNRDKGVMIFYQLAKRFPRHRFLGVMGSHGPQLVPAEPYARLHPELEISNYTSVPPNVEIIGQTTDMKKDVWSRTRLLVVPSVYESYGMVAVEAMASGIPVVATPTPGLKESLGIAGIFANRTQIAGWVYHMKMLLNSPAHWNAASQRCLSRSAALDPAPELKRWVQEIEDLTA
jgi:glycosyltransferase involved in cell wall biosynthesis